MGREVASQLLKKRDSGEGSKPTEQVTVTIQEIAFLKIVGYLDMLKRMFFGNEAVFPS